MLLKHSIYQRYLISSIVTPRRKKSTGYGQGRSFQSHLHLSSYRISCQSCLFYFIFSFLMPSWVASDEMKSVNMSECLFGVLSTMMKLIDACRRVEG